MKPNDWPSCFECGKRFPERRGTGRPNWSRCYRGLFCSVRCAADYAVKAAQGYPGGPGQLDNYFDAIEEWWRT